MKKSTTLRSGWRKRIIGLSTSMAMGIAALVSTVSLSACSKDDESVIEHMNKESEKFYAYWGENLSYLQGIWVEESKKNDPGAGYTIIKDDGNFESVDMLDSNRSRSGNIGQVAGDKNLLIFSNYWANWRLDLHAEWANDSHTRLKTYPDGTDPNQRAEYWVKVNSIPANWVR